jgi:hypothetical protein
MALNEVKTEFLVRYYWWAKEDIKREVREGFPLLGALKDGTCGVAFNFFNRVQASSPEDTVSLMTALLKRRMLNTVQVAGDAYTENEKQLCKDYFQSPLVLNPRQTEFAEKKLAGDKTASVNRQSLRLAIKAELTPLLGENVAKFGKETWRYLTPVGDWTIHTHIDTGGNIHQLSYDHSIGTPEFPAMLTDVSISMQSWLGIAGGPMQWEYLTDEAVPATVESLSKICTHFIKIAPKLLTGISSRTVLQAK